MEARKQPVEIARAFQTARSHGTQAQLVFVGAPSASDFSINRFIEEAVESDEAIQWIRGASDDDVARCQQDADVFLSFGVEGYGIPVLESLRRGTPVLFGGTQPAAELMAGAGSLRIDGDGHQELVAAFERFSMADEIGALQAQVHSDEVPKWETFVMSVAKTCSQA
jgi:glycosyltransferase involved in cell wall biosynthesis